MIKFKCIFYAFFAGGFFMLALMTLISPVKSILIILFCITLMLGFLWDSYKNIKSLINKADCVDCSTRQKKKKDLELFDRLIKETEEMSQEEFDVRDKNTKNTEEVNEN